MSKAKKPAAKAKSPTKKLTALEQMVQDCVKKAQARKKSGQTDREWREQYAKTLKTDEPVVPLSETPFDGDTNKKRNG